MVPATSVWVVTAVRLGLRKDSVQMKKKGITHDDWQRLVGSFDTHLGQ